MRRMVGFCDEAMGVEREPAIDNGELRMYIYTSRVNTALVLWALDSLPDYLPDLAHGCDLNTARKRGGANLQSVVTVQLQVDSKHGWSSIAGIS